MAMRFRGNRLGVELHRLGILPPNCSDVELHIPVDGALMLHYKVFVTNEDIPKIQEALGALLIDAPSLNPSPPPMGDVGGLAKKGI